MSKLLRFVIYISFLANCLNTSAQVFSVPQNINPETVTAPDSPAMPEVWSYYDCVKWAVANNTDLRRVLLSILESEQNIGSAEDAWLPTVGFSTNHGYTNYPMPGNGRKANNYSSGYNLNANWTVWEGNVRKYRLESAKLIKKQQEFNGADQIKTLELGILQAYLNILYSSEAINIAQSSLEVSTGQAERSKRLMENGKISRVDYSQFESQKAQDEYNLIQAQINFSTAVVNLKNLLNLDLEYDLMIYDVEFSDADINAPVPPKKEVYELAQQWLPQFKSNDLNKEIYDYDIKIAKAGYLPSITLSGGVGTGYTTGLDSWGNQMKNAFNENIGVSLSIPIYDANKTKRAITMAKLQAIDYDLTKASLLNDLSSTIDNLYLESENAKARYISGKKQLESFELTSQLVDRQFDLGLVNPLEVLTAHNNLLNARLELLQNKFMAILAYKTIIYYATKTTSIP